MLAIVVLLGLGLFLFVLEAVLPGGIVGTIGAVLILFSAYLIHKEYGGEVAAIYLTASAAAALGLGFASFYFFAKRLSLAPPEPLDGAEAETADLIGKTCVVVSALRPSGTVRVDGRRRPAHCKGQTTEIKKGSAVRVVGRDSTFLLVEPCDAKDAAGLDATP